MAFSSKDDPHGFSRPTVRRGSGSGNSTRPRITDPHGFGRFIDDGRDSSPEFYGRSIRGIEGTTPQERTSYDARNALIELMRGYIGDRGNDFIRWTSRQVGHIPTGTIGMFDDAPYADALDRAELAATVDDFAADGAGRPYGASRLRPEGLFAPAPPQPRSWENTLADWFMGRRGPLAGLGR